ncbi:MAG: 3-phosphoshikimate 1-carboxyvinyltransferase [Gammaproteobacteria bacterium]|nr:3-phosphoshikimate 1-carboxyvinyltransferase [Gammaproteobacteria bacterium]
MSTPARAFVARPGGRVAGAIRVPGDKSISHRAVMLAGIAAGRSEIRGFLPGADCLATLAAMQAMGVRAERVAADHLLVDGAGSAGLLAPAGPLDLGNSGTAMRLLAGLLAWQTFDTVLVGDASLLRRPMERVAAPLRRMGASITTTAGRPPLRLRGTPGLRGCTHRLEVPSAQVKSALLLAGLGAAGRTEVHEPAPTRDHTELMLEAFGVPVERGERSVAIRGPAALRACAIDVPGDFSSAAFFIVAGIVAGAGPLRIRDVGINPRRTGLLAILERMGADIRVLAPRQSGGEPVADLEVHPGVLHGIEVPGELVAAAIDEFPVLFAAAALAEGETVVTGAAELRVKESDRIAVMAEGLQALGVRVAVLPDGLRVTGGAVHGGCVDSHGDHRVAMAFAVLAARAAAAVEIRDVANVQTSFPGFVATARQAGLAVEDSGR